jgi:hypothetical protein
MTNWISSLVFEAPISEENTNLALLHVQEYPNNSTNAITKFYTKIDIT